MTFESLISELTGALEEELTELDASEPERRIWVHAGRHTGRSGDAYLYEFAIEYAPRGLSDEAPVKIEVTTAGAAHVSGAQIITLDDLRVVVATDEKLQDDLSQVALIPDPTFLLRSQIERLKELKEEETGLAAALFGLRRPVVRRGTSVPDGLLEEANEFQAAAVQTVLNRDVTYVWGPPGTGKTTALSIIVAALAYTHQRVLVAAGTNVAVDNATIRIGPRFARAAQVVRLGTPQDPSLIDRDLSPRQSRRLAASVLGGKVQVVGTKGLAQEEPSGDRKRALRQAQVVCATLTRMHLSPELAEPEFDAVVIDEASAASLPAVFCAAALARRKVVVIGDPKQLPPVAVSNGAGAKKWLKSDIFSAAGIDDDDGRVVMLREQYRMAPAISRLANELVYNGRLTDSPEAAARHGSATLVDTSPLEPTCEKSSPGSRLNRTHAQVAVDKARQLLMANASVAIVTPYRPQANLIRRLVRDAHLDHVIAVGTVHSFQGTERDAVVYDTVESPGLEPAGFSTGGNRSDAHRILNVAITRARQDLVVIANVDYLGARLPWYSTLRALLRLMLASSRSG